MKDYVLELAAAQKGYNEKLNILREYLQAYVLRVMYDEGMFQSTAFVGGTALRFLYGLPRFSEDLDFSEESKGGPEFIPLIKKIKQELIAAGYDISITYDDAKTVHSAFIKFERLLFEAKLSNLPAQKFSIKLEIDTNPPAGAVSKTVLINKHFPIAFLSYDIASLFSGKLHALLSRKYAKGRDYFDLGWYLSKWQNLEPNMEMLQRALEQTKWPGDIPAQNNWREFISRVVQQTDWQKVKADVERFLENQKDLNVFTKENLLLLLGRK